MGLLSNTLQASTDNSAADLLGQRAIGKPAGGRRLGMKAALRYPLAPREVFAALRPVSRKPNSGSTLATGHVRALSPPTRRCTRPSPTDGLFLYGPSTSPNALTGDQDSIRVSHVQYHVVGSRQ